ncbi:MAG: multidrag resistance protein [Hydrocarboniphaga sp.]|uniref:HlyD family secretion protein n=1 Tax=Hydrocarboniphaga sp. TaxID=2033016 RepID=UPI0026183936|nr:HlyD family secretion protein [Hydrocarboniphaga sp.]MDB5973035.1 multidrag resistance protein [Hydrocarboniphaga sp.]
MSTATSFPADDSIGNDKTLGERLRVPLMIAGVLVVAVFALAMYLLGGRYMSTGNAYVQAARASISSNVAGQVAEIAVHDNQPVHRGDVLFKLDDQPYRIAVDAAQAKLGSARLQVGAGKAAYRQQMASVRSAQATLAYEQSELERQKKLLASGISSQAQFAKAQNALDTARQQLIAAQQQADSVLAMLAGNPDLDPDQHPSVLQAKAELDRALLNLSYTTIKAPDDGIVTKVEQLQVGDFINPASPVFALMSTRDVWVEANFKEDQLTYMRPGQTATVEIDTYPGRRFDAKVASVAPGTGSQFSALPPENATGNWVKVVQRVPVRLRLEPAGNSDLPLSSGLSATVEVDTGHSRTALGGAQAAQ